MKISVITSTYNRANKIKTQIKSILSQTYQNFEYIIVDDNSSDNTFEIINNFKDKRIKTIRNEKNLKTNASIKKALQIAKGEYIVLIADDDTIHDKTFFEMAMKFNEDIISTKYETVFNVKVITHEFISKKNLLNQNEALKIFEQFVFGGNTIFKKSILQEVMKYDFSHDFSILFFCIIYSNKIRFINKNVFYWYLDTEENTFSANLLKNPYELLKWDLKFLDEIVPILKKQNLYKKYKWFIDEKVFKIFENVEFNYYLTNKEKLFDSLKINNEVYIYGYGQVGVLLEGYFTKRGIKILGFIDDNKNVLKLNQIDKTKQIIIATYKKSLIHKMYKNLIANGVNYKNIVELI